MKKLIFPSLLGVLALSAHAQTVLLDGADADAWLTTVNKKITALKLSRSEVLSPAVTRIPVNFQDTLMKYDWIEAGDYYFKDESFSEGFMQPKLNYSVFRVDENGMQTHLTGGSEAEGEPPFLMLRDEWAPYPVNIQDYGGYSFKCDERGVCVRLVTFSGGVLLYDRLEDENVNDFGVKERFRIVCIAVPKQAGVKPEQVSIPGPPRGGTTNKTATVTSVVKPAPAQPVPSPAKPVSSRDHYQPEPAYRSNPPIWSAKFPVPIVKNHELYDIPHFIDGEGYVVISDGQPCQQWMDRGKQLAVRTSISEKEILNPIHTQIPEGFQDTLKKYDWVLYGNYHYRSANFQYNLKDMGPDIHNDFTGFMVSESDTMYEFYSQYDWNNNAIPRIVAQGKNWNRHVSVIQAKGYWWLSYGGTWVHRIVSYHKGVLITDVTINATMAEMNSLSRFRQVFIAIPKMYP